jgi:two-component system osmolarity sensor histidine kinase EnvZ
MSYRISFSMLKHYMPRSLYGRAALILILPIISLQLGISVVFIQRHFEGVTEQMTSSVALDLQYLLDGVNAAPDLTAAQAIGRAVANPLQLLMT